MPAGVTEQQTENASGDADGVKDQRDAPDTESPIEQPVVYVPPVG